jgi:integrase
VGGLGSVFRRKDGRWCAKYKGADGRERYLYGKKKNEVKEKLKGALANQESEQVHKGNNLTIAAYLDLWLEGVEDTVSPRTYERHESIVRVHLKPALGTTRLANLTPLNVEKLYRKKSKQGLAPGSIRRIHSTLHKALSDAVRWYMLPRNVASIVSSPKDAGEEMKPLTPTQVKQLLSAASDDRLDALYVLAVCCGLRQGEILGLRHEDIDLSKGTLQVRRTLWKGETYPPKTKKSRRTIMLPKLAINALERHRDKLTMDSEWLFPSRNATPVNAYYLIRHSWRKMKIKAGLPESTRFHNLRHTCASILLARGVPVTVVSQYLGHADPNITLRVYAHMIDGMDGVAAQAMDDLLGN